MSVIIGIDAGGTTTKIVGAYLLNGKINLIKPQFVRANDPITAIYGAFGKFTTENRIKISEIEKIMITGVGSSYVNGDIYGVKCEKVSEFDAIGIGGLFTAELDTALVVSLGTGTALVHATRSGERKYLGGTGVGGGTLIGLSRLLLQADTITHIEEYSQNGTLANIDLRISDITMDTSLLNSELTASNFGNVSDIATKEDIAKGILNMVYETVGMISIFAAHSVGAQKIVLTGNLTRLEYCRAKSDFFNSMHKTYGVEFIIPDNSEYATVIGTALYGLNKGRNL
jgi:type II pantothenate kinase